MQYVYQVGTKTTSYSGVAYLYSETLYSRVTSL